MDRSPRTRQWYAHMLIVVAAEFSAESARGLVLPTLFSYAERLGGDLAFVGVLTALFSAGRFVSSLLLGCLSDRVSYKVLYQLSAAIAVVGNLLYVLPYSPRIDSKLLLGASRFIVGFSAGNRSVCRANVAALTRVDQRLSYFTMLATVVFLAYALTPGLGGVFNGVDIQIDESELIYFNEFTAPGFLLAGLNMLTMVLIAVVYDGSVTRDDAPIVEYTRLSQNVRSVETRKPRETSSQMVLWGVLVFMFLNFNARGMLSIFETINVPLYLKTVNETDSAPVQVYEYLFSPLDLPSVRASSEMIVEASHFYLGIGLLGLVSYAVIQFLGGDRGRVSDVGLLLVGFGALLVGNGVLVALSRLLAAGSRDADFEFNLLVIGEILVWSVGSPITSAVIVNAFSKVLGTRPQGTLMGLFGASASIARMAMPLLPGVLPSWELIFLLNIGFCASSIVALAAYLVAQKKADTWGNDTGSKDPTAASSDGRKSLLSEA